MKNIPRMLKKMLWCLRMLLKIKLVNKKVKTSSIRENYGTVLAAGLMELLLFPSLPEK